MNWKGFFIGILVGLLCMAAVFGIFYTIKLFVDHGNAEYVLYFLSWLFILACGVSGAFFD